MRILITGGAGFLGSHLCDLLIGKEHQIVCMDNLITSRMENISHLMGHERFSFVKYNVWRLFACGWAPGRCHALCIPRKPAGLSRSPDRHAQSRCARHAQSLRSCQGKRLPVSSCQHLGGIRRSIGEPATGILLGKCQPDEPTRGIRRSETLCGSHDDGLSSVPRAGHQDRSHF